MGPVITCLTMRKPFGIQECCHGGLPVGSGRFLSPLYGLHLLGHILRRQHVVGCIGTGG